MRHPDPTRRDRVYAFIHTYLRRNGYAPTQHEIARGAGVTHSKVGRYLNDLERAGKIVRTGRFVRNIELAA